MKAPYISSLDGIRAMAVLLVFFSHTTKFVPGMLGVTIFFFLSGYLITTLLRLELGATHGVNLPHFYLRRSIRILPPMYLVLFITLLLEHSRFFTERINLHALLANIFFLTNYYWIFFKGIGIGPGLDVLWSLAVEEHFYLLFPLLYLVIARRYTARRQASILGALCGLILAWRIVLHYTMHSEIVRTRLATDTRIDSILCGCIMAIVANPVLNDGLAGKIRRQLWWLLPLSLSELVLGSLSRNIGFRETLRYTLDNLALFGCFTYAITASGSMTYAFLNWRPVRFLGRISYGFYLVHHVIITQVINRHLHSPPVFRIIAALTVSIAVASCFYYAVDRPMARLRSRTARKRVMVLTSTLEQSVA